MQLKFIDSNVCVGKRGIKNALSIWKTEDILDEMKRTGIAGALVYHGLGREYSPLYGNAELDRELEKSPKLAGCWAALPDHAGDFMPPDEMIRKMREKNIRAVRMFPNTHKFSPNEATCGKLFRALEEAGMTMLLDSTEVGFAELAEIAKCHPGLNIIYQGVYWGQERLLYPVMDVAPRVHADFSCLQSNEIIEVMTERYGAERLIFGSGMPAKSPGAGRALVDYARIPEEAKRLIAGGNLTRLTGFDPPEEATPDADELVAAAATGRIIPATIFDSHTHFLENGGNCGGGQPMIRGGVSDMVKAYNAIGVGKFILAPWLAIYADSVEGNKITAKAMDEYPGRAFGYVLIDANYVEDIEGEARKWHLGRKMPGVKMFFDRTRVRYTDPRLEPWWKIANENKLFALVDPGGYGAFLSDVEQLMVKYPDVIFFLDHAARTMEVAVEYAKYAKKYPNCYLQLTYTSVTLGSIEYLVKEVGADRILYGTDAPMRDPRPQLGWLVYANISEEDKRLILGTNMQKVLDRCFT
jgi:predicted TIM-barrel fold metal-dependent hydrolase